MRDAVRPPDGIGLRICLFALCACASKPSCDHWSYGLSSVLTRIIGPTRFNIKTRVLKLNVSFFEKYGGIQTISTLVHDSYDDILNEPILAPLFTVVDMAMLLDHQVKFFSHVLGGPANYEGRSLESAHRGLSIEDAQFQKLVHILQENLEDLGVESDDVQAILDIVRSVKEKIVENV